jgi:hypothetical protein
VGLDGWEDGLRTFDLVQAGTGVDSKGSSK